MGERSRFESDKEKGCFERSFRVEERKIVGLYAIRTEKMAACKGESIEYSRQQTHLTVGWPIEKRPIVLVGIHLLKLLSRKK